MGGALRKGRPLKQCVARSELEVEIVDAMQQRALQGSTMKSLNTIILKFPKLDESLRNCKTIFVQFDEDNNGTIDLKELKNCLHDMGMSFTEEEIIDLFKFCDISGTMGIEFNEFVVLLCLVYLLQSRTALEGKSRMGLPNLEAAFELLIDAFVFLDKNKDGYISKREMIETMEDTSTRQHSSGNLAMRRFAEMDWDKDGMVTFKEFVFAFTRWIGIDDDLEDEEHE